MIGLILTHFRRPADVLDENYVDWGSDPRPDLYLSVELRESTKCRSTQSL